MASRKHARKMAKDSLYRNRYRTDPAFRALVQEARAFFHMTNEMPAQPSGAVRLSRAAMP